jgi:hypothetical protein
VRGISIFLAVYICGGVYDDDSDSGDGDDDCDHDNYSDNLQLKIGYEPAVNL